jgi:hypothetical protein
LNPQAPAQSPAVEKREDRLHAFAREDQPLPENALSCEAPAALRLSAVKVEVDGAIGMAANVEPLGHAKAS